MSNKEALVTTEFVKILRPMRRAWTLNQHLSKPLHENDREPLIQADSAWPVSG